MDDFYKNLTPSSNFKNLFDGVMPTKVPDDWFILITDIVGSTKAIEEGRYKDVNTAGGLTAIAVANVYGHMDFPFVFGGDGVTFLLPINLLFPIRSAIADTISQVRSAFGLEMRAGIVPVQELYRAGAELFLSKFRASAHYVQCSLFGDALPLAETWIKEGKDESYLVRENEKILPADFTGFTCRWQDVPSERGEIVSLIVKPIHKDFGVCKKTVTRVLNFIRSEYGEEGDYHPLRVNNIELASGSYLRNEALARVGKSSGFRYYLTLTQIWIERTVMAFAMRFGIPLKSGHYSLDKLKDYQVLSADFRKYDGTLKMVIDGSHEHREALVSFLNQLETEGLIRYGIFVSNRSLMTCVLKVASSEEVHFVDGADGGFAMAAKMLKEKLKVM
ncbi:DUF3095 domain-containing protein [Leptospira bourretii]|uniref:DUF3095 domain-containing protein n=1 Tax=Leptospira bourretii TaxID=2484962 RepID=A0A4R9IMB0_9LEPT|nr:DUF3095 domain-containing protein [Leptospira bourretii]TGK85348.1 DUF3095 domain-containing protein [Leptospira bourretii]TGK91108.1 DUF3095 domain-containing protein [Leptospira bourretii]TGL17827.1 DUF3095 domain-containing protein [Leptospira bourretii]TGL30716.1 DUF3095 domain-containing protein [Leptospira bourretii]